MALSKKDINNVCHIYDGKLCIISRNSKGTYQLHPCIISESELIECMEILEIKHPRITELENELSELAKKHEEESNELKKLREMFKKGEHKKELEHEIKEIEKPEKEEEKKEHEEEKKR